MIKDQLGHLIEQAVAKAYPEVHADVLLEKPSNPQFGDFATNVALVLSKTVGKNPREIAQAIQENLSDKGGIIESSSIAGPGFLNFKIRPVRWIEALGEIAARGERFGQTDAHKGEKVIVELVSANPTGPLHIGNARGGPLGDAIASLLQSVGYEVTREYYLNDVGGQIEKLGESLLHYLKESAGIKSQGEVGYQGEYVKELSEAARRQFGDSLVKKGEAEAACRAEAVSLLGKFLTEEIRRDCEAMAIRFDSWVHEKDFLEKGTTQKIIGELNKKKVTIEKEGALWFVPRDEFIEDRECVLVKSDGRPTYFANDIAYHADKYSRGFDRLVNIWGANHHGHVPRIQAGMKALGFDPEKLQTVLYQYVRVVRGKETVKMSKRAGDFVTAREVLDEVGKDALRFFLLLRAPESHLDFDLELAKKQSAENPVYYVQYAHARISSIFAKADEGGIKPPDGFDPDFVNQLGLPEEIALAQMLVDFPSVVELSAEKLDPHRIAYYLLDLARLFQHYYDRARGDDRYRVITGDKGRTQAKLFFVGCFRQVMRNGLSLLGISAPERM
ncbi:MAG: arginine--tRNA ligase [Deltaproteobacteria bacterium]|nr:arginine--tRNA ligase [Deltaproteobacteria bacterium]